MQHTDAGDAAGAAGQRKARVTGGDGGRRRCPRADVLPPDGGRGPRRLRGAFFEAERRVARWRRAGGGMDLGAVTVNVRTAVSSVFVARWGRD